MRSLVPWRQRNGGLFDALEQEMEDRFQRYFGVPMLQGKTNGLEWLPSVDVEETDKEIFVKADLPGIDPKDVELSIRDGNLVIRGEKTEQHEEKKKHFHRVERFSGQFYREVPLPAGFDAEKITASSSKGVLTVTIPKKAAVQPKKIPIKAAD